MNFKQFDQFFDEFVEECRKMRDTKGKEYASSLDRFDNFNRLGRTLDLDRLKIAQVYVQKHLDSVNTFIKTGRVSSTERIRGRFIDIVTYMILMAGMAEEDEFYKNSASASKVDSLSSLTGSNLNTNDFQRCYNLGPSRYRCNLPVGHTGLHENRDLANPLQWG